jgi:MFS family permease
MSIGDTNGITPNAKRLLWAGFFAILAAGVGFGIRGGILDNWKAEYGFTDAELGDIAGFGFTGFCFGIIIGGVIADKIGYGWLVIAAFLFHVLSAFVTFAPTPEMAKMTIYWLLAGGSFIFSFANGTLEAVANPLVATLFPQNRTHYLNILHASWPAGLILGGAAGWVLDDQYQMHWKIQLALFLAPTILYGLMFLGQPMPRSEASAKGLRLGDMFKDVGLLGGLVVCFLLALFFGDKIAKPLLTPENASPEQLETAAATARYIGYGIGGVLLATIGVITRFSIGSFLLFALFVAHGLVGAVELGTDGWIQNITGNILTSEQGKILFVFTSSVMFGLRFCAEFIEKRLGISPVGILLICAVLACAGLNLTSKVDSFGMAILALTVYAVGKTFFWPTMLAVASDRFPRTGAVAISIMGGIGMMSAGLIGSPGLGYFKDRYAAEALRESSPELFETYKAEKPSEFLMFPETTPLDGKKLGAVQQKLNDARVELAKSDEADPQAALNTLSEDERAVIEASIEGDRRTLVTDSLIPATMAVIYLGMMLYFTSIGGYKPVRIDQEEHELTEWGPGEG